MPEYPYCPVCKAPLDAGNRCWSVCDLAGIAQPAIHIGEFEEDHYEVRNGLGQTVKVITTLTLVEPREHRA